jgi:DNA repair exonuclease SbcCD ATPase subunit
MNIIIFGHINNHIDSMVESNTECIDRMTSTIKNIEESAKEITEKTVKLEEKTSVIEDSSKKLEERTSYVEGCSKKLEERAAGIEDLSKKLDERTLLVEESSKNLGERTSLIEDYTKRLEERTDSIDETKKSLEELKVSSHRLMNESHSYERGNNIKLLNSIKNTKSIIVDTNNKVIKNNLDSYVTNIRIKIDKNNDSNHFSYNLQFRIIQLYYITAYVTSSNSNNIKYLIPMNHIMISGQNKISFTEEIPFLEENDIIHIYIGGIIDKYGF